VRDTLIEPDEIPLVNGNSFTTSVIPTSEDISKSISPKTTDF
jgi:hypothetical protein